MVCPFLLGTVPSFFHAHSIARPSIYRITLMFFTLFALKSLLTSSYFVTRKSVTKLAQSPRIETRSKTTAMNSRNNPKMSNSPFAPTGGLTQCNKVNNSTRPAKKRTKPTKWGCMVASSIQRSFVVPSVRPSSSSLPRSDLGSVILQQEAVALTDRAWLNASTLEEDCPQQQENETDSDSIKALRRSVDMGIAVALDEHNSDDASSHRIVQTSAEDT